MHIVSLLLTSESKNNSVTIFLSFLFRTKSSFGHKTLCFLHGEHIDHTLWQKNRKVLFCFSFAFRNLRSLRVSEILKSLLEISCLYQIINWIVVYPLEYSVWWWSKEKISIRKHLLEAGMVDPSQALLKSSSEIPLGRSRVSCSEGGGCFLSFLYTLSLQ